MMPPLLLLLPLLLSPVSPHTPRDGLEISSSTGDGITGKQTAHIWVLEEERGTDSGRRGGGGGKRIMM